MVPAQIIHDLRFYDRGFRLRMVPECGMAPFTTECGTFSILASAFGEASALPCMGDMCVLRYICWLCFLPIVRLVLFFAVCAASLVGYWLPSLSYPTGYLPTGAGSGSLHGSFRGV